MSSSITSRRWVLVRGRDADQHRTRQCHQRRQHRAIGLDLRPRRALVVPERAFVENRHQNAPATHRPIAVGRNDDVDFVLQLQPRCGRSRHEAFVDPEVVAACVMRARGSQPAIRFMPPSSLTTPRPAARRSAPPLPASLADSHTCDECARPRPACGRGVASRCIQSTVTFRDADIACPYVGWRGWSRNVATALPSRLADQNVGSTIPQFTSPNMRRLARVMPRRRPEKAANKVAAGTSNL
jgi:hypothetical protein